LYGGGLNTSCMSQNQSQAYPDKKVCEYSTQKLAT